MRYPLLVNDMHSEIGCDIGFHDVGFTVTALEIKNIKNIGLFSISWTVKDVTENEILGHEPEGEKAFINS
jgi:hypothetical protein